MAANKRSKHQREKDLAELSALLLEGWTQQELAARFGISRQQLGYDIAILDERWQKEQLANQTARKLRRHNELERAKRLALAAFARSREDAETLHAETTKGRTRKGRERVTKADGTVTERTTETPLPDLVKQTKTVKGQAGDAALLEKYIKAVAEQVRLWGDAAAQKHDVTSGGEPFYKTYGFDPTKPDADPGDAPA